MSSPQEPDASTGGGFVTCPLWILTHPGLTDCDIRVLLILDQIGWREVEPNQPGGVVHASNQEIGHRIGKSSSTVSASIRRIEMIRPAIISREMSSSNSRSGLVLVYDRYGCANMNVPTKSTFLVAQDVAEVAEILATSDTTPTLKEAVTQTFPEVAENLTLPAVAEILATLPLKREEHHHLEEGEVAEILATSGNLDGTEQTAVTATSLPRMPKTVEELIEWLPTMVDCPDAVRRFGKRIPQWIARLEDRLPLYRRSFIDWVYDAVMRAADKEDPVPYADSTLMAWVNQGGRPHVELAPKAPETSKASFQAAPSGNGYHPPAARLTQGQKAAADRERIRESFRANKAKKGLIDAHGA